MKFIYIYSFVFKRTQSCLVGNRILYCVIYKYRLSILPLYMISCSGMNTFDQNQYLSDYTQVDVHIHKLCSEAKYHRVIPHGLKNDIGILYLTNITGTHCYMFHMQNSEQSFVPSWCFVNFLASLNAMQIIVKVSWYIIPII